MAEHFGELAAAQAFTGAELLVLDQSAETRRTTLGDVAAYVGQNLTAGALVTGGDAVFAAGVSNVDRNAIVGVGGTGIGAFRAVEHVNGAHYIGGFVRYASDANAFQIGTHDVADTVVANDIVGIELARSTAAVTVKTAATFEDSLTAGLGLTVNTTAVSNAFVVDDTTGQLRVPDGGSAAAGLALGNGQDLTIYHTGAHSYIRNVTGSLYVTDGSTTALSIDASQQVTCHQGFRVDTTGASGAFFVNDASGNVGIGAVSTLGGYRLRVRHSTAGEANTIWVEHNDTTNSLSHSVLRLQTDASAGDPYIRYTVGGGGAEWSQGIDNSVSDEFRICNAGALGSTGLALSIDTSELVTCHQGIAVSTTGRSSAFLVDDTTGNVGIGAAVSTSAGHILRGQYSVAGTSLLAWFRHTDNTSSGSDVRLLLETGGETGGDPYINWQVDGVADWSMGIDNSDSNSLQICNSSVVGSSVAMTISTDELVRCHKGLRIDTTGYGSLTLTVDDSSGVTTVRGGCVLSPVASDPGLLVNGQIWITDAGELKFRANGTTQTVTAA